MLHREITASAASFTKAITGHFVSVFKQITYARFMHVFVDGMQL